MTTTALGLRIIPDVDLTRDVPCQAKVCSTMPEHPATWFARGRCPCGTDTETWCERARRAFLSGHWTVACEARLHHTHTLAFTITFEPM